MSLTVVTGPPAAGKSTYVQTHARPGDIVIDYDLLAAALSPRGDTHNHPKVLAKVAYRARAVAIDEALRHVDDLNVWLIHTDPTPETLARYAQHGARMVTVDPGYDVVMDRITRERPHSARAVATRWYNHHVERATTRETGPTPTTSRNW